jgi:quinol monooxygenase YgiN
MNKFVLLVEFQVKPESIGRFNELIDVNARASVTNEPGCRQFDVCRTQDDPCRIVLYEVYDSEEAFKAHMGMAHTQTFLAAAKLLVDKQTVTRLTRTVAPPVKAG